jgi:hypothetical protein
MRRIWIPQALTPAQIALAKLGKVKLNQTHEAISASIEEEKRKKLHDMLSELNVLLLLFIDKPGQGELFKMYRVVQNIRSFSKRQIPLPSEIQQLVNRGTRPSRVYMNSGRR